ncbi:MAG: efflux RND transporter periplasmic adaptor subunit [Proteobacteria bacterium]|nr:efflux RND transporter periplasmic adaptor subunit [Pseudomonadota bacterium]
MGRIIALRRATWTVFLGLGLIAAALPARVSAHGGHEDEELVAAASLGTSGTLRLNAKSDDFELVAVPHGRMLTIYLDRFADNHPVTDARIEVEVNGVSLSAEASADGTYLLSADWIAAPGEYDPVFTIVTPEQSDLLTGKLVISSASRTGAVFAGGNSMLAVPSGDSKINLALAFLLGMLTMWAIPKARGVNSAAVVAELEARAARSTARVRAAADAALVTSRKTARQYRRTLSRARAQLAMRANERISQIRNIVATFSLGPRPAFLSVRKKLLRGSGITSLTLMSFGFFFVALLLIFLGRGVFAHGTGADDADAAKPPTAVAIKTAEAAAGPKRLLDGTVFVPKSAQRLLEVQTTVTQIGEAARSLRIAGQVIADPGTSGQVHSSIRGRVVPANGVWPRVGQPVRAGEVLAWVVPVINPIDRGIIFQQLAQIDQEIALTQERVQRVTDAKASAREIDDARSDLANLSRRRAAIALVLRDRDTLRAPLLAPSEGLIAASFSVAGQLVDEQQKLFEVVDPKRLWVEAYAYDITAIGVVTGADATSSVGQSYKLKFVSRGPRLQKQTIPLYFQIEDPDTSLSVGSLVSVLVQAADRRRGVILPRSAVVKDSSGQSIVWQHVDAETFAPLPVHIEAIDGAQVLILAGVKANTRIVVNSAYLLSEIR